MPCTPPFPGGLPRRCALGLRPPGAVRVLRAMPERAAPPVRAWSVSRNGVSHWGLQTDAPHSPLQAYRTRPSLRTPSAAIGHCSTPMPPLSVVRHRQARGHDSAHPLHPPPAHALGRTLPYNPQGVSKDLRTDDGDAAPKAAAEEASASRKKAAAK